MRAIGGVYMSNELIVSVKHLNKFYGKRKVLDDISFDIYHNEIVGFIGPNGAGKSTTMKCLCNLIYPSSGEITINGYDIYRHRENALSCQASLIESPGLYMDMTGYDNMKLIAKLRKVPIDRLNEMIAFSHLGKAIDVKVRKYSLGMKQRLGLAIALLSKPKFLILDEPTNGLDPTGVIELRNTLQELVKKEDISILFSSHQLGEIEKLANRILCINNGKLVDIPDIAEKKAEYIIQVSDSTLAVQLLHKNQQYPLVLELTKDSIQIGIGEDSHLQEVLYQLMDNGVRVLDITKVAVNIEQLYSQVYGEHHD